MLVALSLFGMLFLGGMHQRDPNLPAAAHAHVSHDVDETGSADNDHADQLAGHGALHGEIMPTQFQLAFVTPSPPSAWHVSFVGLRPSGDPSETLRPPQG